MTAEPKGPPPLPGDDEAIVAIILQAFDGVPAVELVIDPLCALSLASMLQLVLRHPDLSHILVKMATTIARQIQDGLVEVTGCQQIGLLLEYGFDPAHDRDRDGNPIVDQRTKIDLIRAAQKGIIWVKNDTDRELLADFLLSVVEEKKEELIVEVNLDDIIK